MTMCEHINNKIIRNELKELNEVTLGNFSTTLVSFSGCLKAIMGTKSRLLRGLLFRYDYIQFIKNYFIKNNYINISLTQ